MPIAVRPVEPGDIPAMAAIRAQEWETETFWAARIGWYLSGEHSPQHALPARAAFVAVESGTVVGFTAGHLTRRYSCDGELQWMNVLEARRRQGIAARMLATVAEWLVQEEALRVCVNVTPENVAARGLYSKYGALPLNDHWMVWEDARAMLNPPGTNLAQR